MSARDLKLREGLLQEGKLFGGYNKEMEKLHNDNAQRLEEIINAIGWPTGAKVGTDGAEAAWLILQHAIARPDLLKSCLSLLQQAAERGEIPAKYPAYLEDRICFFQGQPQKYGTQFDWDEKGQLNYWPLQDEENVDQLRKDIGLPPLAEQVKVMRQRELPGKAKSRLTRGKGGSSWLGVGRQGGGIRVQIPLTLKQRML